MPYKDKEKRRRSCREYYHTHKDEIKKLKRKWEANNKQRRWEYFKTRRKETQTWLSQLRTEMGCKECGEKHPAVLDFHHQGKKLFNVADMMAYSRKTILAEIGQCVVMCSNCHRKSHWTE